MNFKKSKEEVITDANVAAIGAIASYLGSISCDPGSYSQKAIVQNMQVALQEGIHEAIKSLVNNTYTDADFERDLTLRQYNYHYE